ncbi:MAG: sporulation integral membrane protein YlbJ [Clostridia bacterium]|nr:sporulation integral membrane protein YlbJ [Clostridia bacterium]
MVFLVAFSTPNLSATKAGLTLWAKNVVPSLFPFFIATELLNYTNLPYYLGKLTNKFMRPLFNVPGEGSYAFIMGIISGYPVGAKIVNKFIEDGTCTKYEAERMLAFTNNSGPLFIVGTVGISLFGDVKIGIILFITHILACLTVGLIFGFFSKYSSKKHAYPRNINTTSSYNISDLGTILSNSISNAISTILLIGGFIVLFSIIISILNSLSIIDSISNLLSYANIPPLYSKCILTGLLELTNGINAVSLIHTKYMSIQIILSSFLLGFAGFSIFLQIFSIASKNNLSMKPYFIGKLLQGIISALYTFIILCTFDFFYFDITTL